MTAPIRFFVEGLPAPKGSTSSFQHKTTGAIITMASNPKEQKSWRERIQPEARKHFPQRSNEPFSVALSFIFDRPKGHFTPKGKLRPAAPRYKITAPDTDKLTRCVLDALTNIVFCDDRQVVYVSGYKRFAEEGEKPGAWITITPRTSAQQPPENCTVASAASGRPSEASYTGESPGGP